jgi:hypothetical protein
VRWLFLALPFMILFLLAVIFMIPMDHMEAGQVTGTKIENGSAIITIKTNSIISPNLFVMNNNNFQISNFQRTEDPLVFTMKLTMDQIKNLKQPTILFNCGSESLISFIFGTLIR